MENQNQLPEEEIPNIDQFQTGRNPSDDDVQPTDPGNEDENLSEESGYTPGESEFADGEGTLLDEQSEEFEIDSDETDDENDGTALEAPNSEEAEEDADFENPDDDPA